MIRIAHFADVHLDETTREQVEPALAELVRQIEQEEPDLIVFSGDLYVRRGHLSPRALLVARSRFAELGRVAPFVVIPGNHDLQHRLGPDSVTASFARFVGDNLLDPREQSSPAVFYRPGKITVAGVQIVALPYPSRYVYLANKLRDGSADIANIEHEISAALTSIVEGMVAHLDPDKPTILVWHGTVEGGLADNEQMMTTADDIALRQGGLLDRFDAILAGHLHRRQDVGKVHYPGAIAPLTFSDAGRQFGWTLWNLPERQEVHLLEGAEFHELPVTHPMVSIEITPDLVPDPQLVDSVVTYLTSDLPDTANVRVVLKLSDEDFGATERAGLEAALSERFWRHKIVHQKVGQTRVRVSDIAPETKVEELFEKYAVLYPDLEPDVEELVKLNSEIDGRIPTEERMRYGGTDYEPHRILWRDYKPLAAGEINLDELGKLVCIAGENTAGKSNLAEIESFALWKATRGSPLAATIRNWQNGGRSCQVEIQFVCDGMYWRVIRSVKASSRGAKADLVVQRCDNYDDKSAGGSGWVPANWGDARETQRKLEELVGSFDLYRATRFGSQFDVDRLLNMKPAELKDTIQEALGILLFDRRKDEAAAWLKDVSRRRLEVAGRIATLSVSIEARGSLEQELEEYRVAVGDLAQERAIHEKAQEDLRRQIADLGAKLAGVSTLDREHRSVRQDLEDRDLERQSIEKKRERLQRIIGDADRIRAGVAKVKELKAHLEELQDSQAKVNDLARRRSDLQRELSDLKAKHERAIDSHDSEIAYLREQKAGLEKRCKMLQEVETSVGCTNRECPLLRDAVQAEQSLPSLLDQLEEAETRLETLKREKVGSEQQAEIQRLAKEIERIPYSSQDHIQARSRLQQAQSERWEDLERELLQAEATQREISNRLAAIGKERKALEERERRVRDDLAALGDSATLKKGLGAAECQLNQTIARLQKLQAQSDDLNQRIGQLTGALERINQDEVERTKLQEADRGDAEQERLLKLYVKAVSRDGIPFLFLEQALPTIEARANWFLGSDLDIGTLAVEIAPMRDTQSGTTRDEVVITFRDEKGRGFPLQEASGFQRMALGVALRAALAQAQAEVTGSKVSHFWQDEGFGAYDTENLALAKVLVSRLADTFERFIYITHVPEMIQVADDVIWVERDPASGSTIRMGAKE